jgi:hypothetical protein
MRHHGQGCVRALKRTSSFRVSHACLPKGCYQLWSAFVREPGYRGERPPEPGRMLADAPRAVTLPTSRRSKRCWKSWREKTDVHNPPLILFAQLCFSTPDAPPGAKSPETCAHANDR